MAVHLRQLTAEGTIHIPITTREGKTIIRADAVKNDIPLILSEPEMENLEVALDLVKEEVKIKGETRRLRFIERQTASYQATSGYEKRDEQMAHRQ